MVEAETMELTQHWTDHLVNAIQDHLLPSHA